MAAIVRYVDTGSDAGGDGTTSATSSGDNTHAYQSLNAWEVAEETDLDTANNTHTFHTNRTNSGGIDQLICLIDGWTTSVTDFITVIADDFPAGGIYDDTKYIIENNDDTAAAVDIKEDFVRLINLQVLLTTTNGIRFGIRNSAQGAGAIIHVDSCIVKGVCSGTDDAIGIMLQDADATVYVYNTIVFDFIAGADTGFRGIQTKGTVNIYNCTISNCYYGIIRSTETTIAINCAVFNNTIDFGGTVTIINCATDESAGEGANGVDISGTWDTTCFTAPEADPPDFSVQDDQSPVYQTGNGATPKSIFTDDIIGTTRDAVDLNWDIGAFELIVAVGNAGIMTTNTGYWGPTF